MKNQWKLIPTYEDKVNILQKELNLDRLLCQLLVQRGMDSVLEVQKFLNPSLTDLHDPFLMRGMANAVSRIRRAINQNETVLLYGDYDVDGTTSVALLFSFLNKVHSKLDFYIPDRYKEGYGVSMEGIDYASQNGVDLIISIDCGIKAIEAVKEAKKRNIDFIILDHHLPDKELPQAVAILDPKQPDCDYPFKELSGCGIAFKLVQGLSFEQQIEEEEIYALLDLVAVSIASDIVPIIGENRILANYGLKRLNQNPRLGLDALMQQSGRENALTISDIVYGIGPMINAAGRMADARLAVKTLLSNEKFVASEYSTQLDHLNKQRKEFDKKIVQEAEVLIKELVDLDKQNSIVLYQPHWHKGVVGIAASRIVEKFNRPTIIMTESNGKIVGSARSVPEFDIYEVIQSCEKFLLGFGGHKHAAGLTMVPENLKQFSEAFEQMADQINTFEAEEVEIPISAELDLNEISSPLWESIKKLAPFGPGNRNPNFVSRNITDTGYSKLLKNNHLKLSVKQGRSPILNGIAFGQGDVFEKVKRHPFAICYNLHENYWKGKTTIQLNVKDIKFAEE